MINDPTDPLFIAPRAAQSPSKRSRPKGGAHAPANGSGPSAQDDNRITLEQALMFDAFEEPLVLHRAYVDVGGSIMAGLWLSYAEQLERQRLEVDPHADGWFALSREEWYRATGLTVPEQATARRRLRALGVIEERRRGMPAALEHRIDHEKLSLLLKERTRLIWGDRLVEEDRL